VLGGNVDKTRVDDDIGGAAIILNILNEVSFGIHGKTRVSRINGQFKNRARYRGASIRPCFPRGNR
jgi:hypothetical protein